MDWKRIVLAPERTIRDAMQVLNDTLRQIVLVADSDGRLLGTVTDGDIRRGILRGLSPESLVAEVMFATPTTGRPEETRTEHLSRMRDKIIKHLPLVDGQGLLCGLVVADEPGGSHRHDNPVVLMVGGLGTRLHPLTLSTPKPMLPIGGRPVLETIVDNFVAQGFWRFHLAVNYKSEVIKNHFGDGSRWGAHITYLEEETRLGTAGALGLLPERPTLPMIVMNGDVLTTMDFTHLIAHHAQHGAKATMCVREYDFQVPFGVVETDQARILDIIEKPVHRFFVNAGIYVLEPAVLDYIAPGQELDIPQLFRTINDDGGKAVVFPLHEYWLDIGRIDDFQRANDEFEKIFG